MQLLSSVLLGASLVLAQTQAPGVTQNTTQVKEIPILGLGTWHFQDNNTNVKEVIAAAIENGYRHIDCAYAYGNQKEIGQGIQEGLKRTGLNRRDLWITSKLWNNRHGKEEFAIQETLDQLGLDYLDLWLVHWPMGNSTGTTTFDFIPTWKAMEKLVRPVKGTRFIGISNFSPNQLDELMKVATIKPTVHQIELHPYLPQTEFIKAHEKYNITVQAYSPLGNTNPVYGQTALKEAKILSSPVIESIAKARTCTPAQVVLGWNLRRKVVVIPKAVKLEHQVENLATLEKCKLQAEDMQKINDIKTTLRLNSGSCQSLGYKCFEGLAGI